MAAFERILIELFNQDLKKIPSIAEGNYSTTSPVNEDDIASMLGVDGVLKECIKHVMSFCYDNDLYIADWEDLHSACTYVLDNNLIDSSLRDGLNHILLKISIAKHFGLSLIQNYRGLGLKAITGVADFTRTFENISSGEEFEWYCTSILRKKGYINIITTPTSGDHGVDIIAEKDNVKYAIQCKYYSTPVGNHAVQEVFSGRAFYKCDVGVVISNNSFTKQAIEEATALGVKLWILGFDI